QTFETIFDDFEQWLETGVETISNGNKIIIFGNGGSAADAQHIAAEMSVKLKQDRAPIPAISLSMDASAITACGNDYGFEYIFSRQIEALGRKGDMAVGISTSGNSANVLKALTSARTIGMKTIGLCGSHGGKMPEHCDIILKIPSDNTARIQEMHITMGHIFVGALEKKLGLV
ncbi:MAG: D-sedoheptulose 7-phosphate isomerase, partial [Alphaproteobacteria bacterium]|nr:D-sedoheptulose 7-phosphate isomerase [Alphaproteobacteria bacterium]